MDSRTVCNYFEILWIICNLRLSCSIVHPCRLCEICGETAKNVTGVSDNRFLEEWNEQGITNGAAFSSGRRRGCLHSQPLCNFLMACLVIAFVLPWFFRVNMFWWVNITYIFFPVREKSFLLPLESWQCKSFERLQLFCIGYVHLPNT